MENKIFFILGSFAGLFASYVFNESCDIEGWAFGLVLFLGTIFTGAYVSNAYDESDAWGVICLITSPFVAFIMLHIFRYFLCFILLIFQYVGFAGGIQNAIFIPIAIVILSVVLLAIM